ncbi:hypothetical protein [Geopseudomonas aromaticivorans]
MKKVTLAAMVTLGEQFAGISREQIQHALSQFGDVDVKFIGECETADSTGLSDAVWLYFTADEEQPVLVVAEPFASQGMEVDVLGFDAIRDKGVVVEVVGEYPRAERHGHPHRIADAEASATVAGELGLRVDLDVLKTRWVDRRDDGADTYWLKVMLPAGTSLAE